MVFSHSRLLLVLAVTGLTSGMPACVKKSNVGAKKKSERPDTSSNQNAGRSTSGRDLPREIGGTDGIPSGATPAGVTETPSGLGGGDSAPIPGYIPDPGATNGTDSGSGVYNPGSQGYIPNSPGSGGGGAGSDPNRTGTGGRGGSPGQGGGAGQGGRTAGTSEDDRGNGPRIYLQATDKGVFLAFGTNSPDIQPQDREAAVSINFSQKITSKETSAALQGTLNVSFSRTRDPKTCKLDLTDYTISATQGKFRRTQCN